MPGQAKLVLFEDRSGIVVQEEPSQLLKQISVARRADAAAGFVKLTASDGKVVFIAIDKILYIEPE